MKKIGLFGGTFDPVHIGHVSIAKAFLNSGQIDELWILLTPFPPHKKKQKHAHYTLRFNMLQLAFEEIKSVSIITIENELPEPSYTYQSIAHLKALYPEYNFVFCMGEDSLANFSTWKHYNRILDQVKLLVARRPGESHFSVEKHILLKTIFVDHEPVEVASSEIRELIDNEEDVKRFLPLNVYELIEKEGLYR